LSTGAAISEPERPRAVAHAGHGDAADLRGDIGPERQRALRHRIDEAQQILRPRPLQPRQQPFLELGERRRHPLIAMPPDRDDHPMQQPRGRLRLRRQPVAQSFGQEAGGDAGHLGLIARFRRHASAG
jgi:hypothetical protein